MKIFQNETDLEIGIDEVARGCLFGPVYAASVIWPQDEELSSAIQRDSKKYSRSKRLELRDYIIENAVDYSVGWISAERIDKVNIMNATFEAMHQSLDGIEVNADMLLVDGDRFKPYRNRDGDLIPHQCIVSGDSNYCSIACASILAKVEHDLYINQLCQQFPILDEWYHLSSNMGYGSANHRQGIQEHGLSPFHRQTFGELCRQSSVAPELEQISLPSPSEISYQ